MAINIWFEGLRLRVCTMCLGFLAAVWSDPTPAVAEGRANGCSQPVLSSIT